MKFSTVLRLVAIYKGIPANDYKKYIDSYDSFSSKFAVDTIKSVKFDSRVPEARKLNASSKSEIDGDVAGVGIVKVVQYGIHEEEPNRYAFFSDAYTDNLFIRMFDKSNKLDKFLSNIKITVRREVSIGSAKIVEYTSENSNTLRHAVYMPTGCMVSDDDIQKFEGEYSAVQANADEKTSVFN